MGYQWRPHGALIGCPWGVLGVSMGRAQGLREVCVGRPWGVLECTWGAHDVWVGRPWAICRQLTGYPSGAPIGRSHVVSGVCMGRPWVVRGVSVCGASLGRTWVARGRGSPVGRPCGVHGRSIMFWNPKPFFLKLGKHSAVHRTYCTYALQGFVSAEQ